MRLNTFLNICKGNIYIYIYYAKIIKCLVGRLLTFDRGFRGRAVVSVANYAPTSIH